MSFLITTCASIKSWAMHVWEHISAYPEGWYHHLRSSYWYGFFQPWLGNLRGRKRRLWLPSRHRGALRTSWTLPACCWWFHWRYLYSSWICNWQATAASIYSDPQREPCLPLVFSMVLATQAEVRYHVVWLRRHVPPMLAVFSRWCYVRICCIQYGDAPCFAAVGSIRRQMRQLKMVLVCLLATRYLCMGCRSYHQPALGVLRSWFLRCLDIAFAFLAAILFQLFRPSQKWDKKDDKIIPALPRLQRHKLLLV